MINDAKSRARRSILIDHCGIEHIDLKSDFNNIEHVYSIERVTKRGISKLSLIEFKYEQEAENIAKQAKHNEGLLPVPLKIFRYNGGSSKISIDQQDLPFPVDHVRISYQHELEPSIASYSDLVSNNMMSLVALKLRFITLVNFERVLCAGMFEEYELMPFGSSVVDTGCDSGDLDLVVTRKEDHHQLILDSLSKPKKAFTQGRNQKLLHLDKSLYSEAKDNSGIKGTMKWFDHILREYMPLTDGYGVLLVSRAKVPIIKFTARITSIDCDLSFNLGLDHRERDIMTTNYSGILMSQIMYSLCRNNNLFPALVTYLKIFGGLTSVTSKEPNIGFTNFQFLSLILFYLQQIAITSRVSQSREPRKFKFIKEIRESKHAPMIPPFKDLLNPSFKYPKIILTDDQLNQALPELISGFFEFYSDFDFTGKSLNLYEGQSQRKLDNSSIYVVNPLDRSRNICHNVNKKGLDSLIRKVQTAIIELRSSEKKDPLSLIKILLLENEKQQHKKVRPLQNRFDNIHQDGVRLSITTEEIAQDVCR